MACNVGKIDRIVRILGGAGLLSLAFVGPHTPWGYLGAVPLITGLLGFCPAYTLFRKKECCLPDKNHISR